MITQGRSEKGQAIVMIAFAIIGLIGLVALAMDGGHAFSDRRQAQNAADAAALAAALRYANDQTITDFTGIVQTSASANGYDNTPGRSAVVLTTTTPAITERCTSIPGKEGVLFKVDIDSWLPTWFGTVVGISQVHNHVTSTALGCPPFYEIAYNGNTIVALNKTSCRAMEFSGTSSTTITSSTGEGIFTDSKCTGSNTQNALYAGGSGAVSAPNVSSVGGVYHPETFQLPPGGQVKTGVAPIERKYNWPLVGDICPTNTSTVVSGNTLTPGVYPGDNNSWKTKGFPPAGITNLNPGVYCLDNGFKMTGGELTGIGVTIVMRDQGIDIQGGNIKLWAPTSGLTKGLLFYMPESNTGDSISINGNGDSEYHGSIVAPAAHVSINGTSGTTGAFQTQVIADTITIGGGGNIMLSYDAELQYKPPRSAAIQMLR